MKKETKIKIIIIGLIVLAISIFIGYKLFYLPHIQAKQGWVYSKSWDCPSDHPIKANLESHIYHTRSSPYYERTNAENCKCFNTSANAKQQGFRAPLNK